MPNEITSHHRLLFSSKQSKPPVFGPESSRTNYFTLLCSKSETVTVQISAHARTHASIYVRLYARSPQPTGSSFGTAKKRRGGRGGELIAIVSIKCPPLKRNRGANTRTPRRLGGDVRWGHARTDERPFLRPSSSLSERLLAAGHLHFSPRFGQAKA